MTDFFINSKKVEIKDSDLSTVHDLMEHTMDSHASKDDVITGLYLNDHYIEENLEKNFLMEPIDKFEKVQINIANKIELAFQALENSDTYVDNLLERIKTSAKSYRENDIAEGNLLFAEIIETLDLFVQLITNVRSIVTINEERKSAIEETIQKLETHLLTLCRSLFSAREKDDIIMLCDLLEYELTDNLVQWKTQVIPALIESKTN